MSNIQVLVDALEKIEMRMQGEIGQIARKALADYHKSSLEPEVQPPDLASLASHSCAVGNTTGQLITEAINLHELNPDVVEKEFDFPKGVLRSVMADEYYTNSVPIVLFKNLIVSLHIPFEKIKAAMKPTFEILLSKETSESIKKKPLGYKLWENEESLTKYTNHLQNLINQGDVAGSQTNSIDKKSYER